MKELIVRGISGVLYITIIVFAMFASREWYLVLFFILGVLTLNEFQKLVRLKSYLSFFIFAILFYFLSYKVFDPNPISLYAILAIFVNLFLLKDLLVTSKIPMFEKKKYITVVFYIIAGFVFLALIPFRGGVFFPEIIIGIFVLIWVNDSFAYLIGKNFGKRKLLERISPKKTIEGFFGGFFATLIASFIISKYVTNLSLTYWIFLGLIVSVLGTFGDLIQSKFKRQAGVKDSGVIMPGHGGIYDRLDSVLYVSPFIYSFLEIVDYVS